MALLRSAARRRFTATLAAAATALALMTAAAIPARAASGTDMTREFAAMSEASGASLRPTAIVPVHQTFHPGNSGYARGHGHGPHPGFGHPRADRRPVLPAACAVELRHRRYSEVVYPERCLRRSGIDARLPRHCTTLINLRGRHVTALSQNCLLDAGFRTRGRSYR